MRAFLQTSKSPAQRGFTLIEMMVSLAVIAVALVVVVSAFTITTKTARQAAAFSELSAAIRQWETQLDADLRGIDPSQSILVISGMTQAAGLSEQDRAASRHVRFLVGDSSLVPSGYDPVRATVLDSTTNPQYSDPRADALMFITKRASTSQAPVPATTTLNTNNLREAAQAAYRDGAKVSPMLVTYGHAALGEVRLGQNGFAWTDNLKHIFRPLNQRGLNSDLPITRWYLARRALLVEQTTDPTVAYDPANPYDPRLNTQADVFKRIQRCRPYPEQNPIFAGDVVSMDIAGLLKSSLLDPLFHPYEGLSVRANSNWIGPSTLNAVNALLYPPDNNSRTLRHIATVLEEPPAEMASNSALNILPGCGWFQVEFLMPENPRNAIDNPDINTRTENFRWSSVVPNRTYVFVPDSAANRARILEDASDQMATTGSITGRRLADFTEITPDNQAADDISDRRVRTWPYALRITVRAYDPRGRMTDPIIRSVVHRFD